MNVIPSIFELLEYFDFVRGFSAAYLVLFTAAIILITLDWRLMLSALTGQYLVAGLLFADVITPRLAFTKVIVGLFIVLILYFTCRQTNWGKLPVDVSEDEVIRLRRNDKLGFGKELLATNRMYRLFLALLLVLVAWTISKQPGFQLPIVPEHIDLAVYSLVCLGIAGAAITTEPLKVGVGILTMMTGFELFYSALEPSLALIAFIAGADLLAAIVIAYLTQARHSLPELLD